jgi:hypothetical protein
LVVYDTSVDGSSAKVDVVGASVDVVVDGSSVVLKVVRRDGRYFLVVYDASVDGTSANVVVASVVVVLMR